MLWINCGLDQGVKVVKGLRPPEFNVLIKLILLIQSVYLMHCDKFYLTDVQKNLLYVIIINLRFMFYPKNPREEPFFKY